MKALLRVDTGDGSVFPAVAGDAEHDSLEWVLRYGTPEQVVEARMCAASVVEAYRALIRAPKRRRDQIVAAIRDAVERDAAESYPESAR